MQTGLLIFIGLLAFACAQTATDGSTTETSIITTADTSTLAPAVTSTPAPAVTSTPATDVTSTLATDVTSSISTSTTTKAPCKYENMFWGDEDPRIYYFCANGSPIQMECDEYSYFVSNATLAGCVPADLMDPSCVNLDVVVQPCSGIYMRRPQASETLTNFWLCTAQNETPIELPCKENTAFVNSGGYTGCLPWSTWRELRDCN